MSGKSRPVALKKVCVKRLMEAPNDAQMSLLRSEKRRYGPLITATLATITALSAAKQHQQLPLIEFVELHKLTWSQEQIKGNDRLFFTLRARKSPPV